MKTLTVISPVYNEAEVIEHFCGELKKELGKLKGRYKTHVLFVVDKGTDGTLDTLRRVCGKDKSVSVLALSSRFGHQMSLLAGIDHADSDAVVMMDCDLQHPPALIHEMVKEYEKGSAVVYAVRKDTDEIGWFKRAGSRLFYWFINKISDIPINENAADFRLISRPVLKVLKEQVRERNIFFRGIISWLGFKQTPVAFTVQKRYAGSTKYSLHNLLRLGKWGVLSFSKKPLQAAVFFGVLFALFAFVNAAVTFVQYFIYKSLPSGWTTIVILLSFLGGVQLIFLGIIGEYIGGIFDEVKGRPHYIVEEKLNLR